MPRSSRFPCRQSGCSALLIKPGYCDQHRRESFKTQKKFVSVDYAERNRFYQRKEWKAARTAQLEREPLCRHCRRIGRLTEATHVDHVVPISDGGDLIDDANLQSLCKPCHERKTRREGRGSQISTG